MIISCVYYWRGYGIYCPPCLKKSPLTKFQFIFHYSVEFINDETTTPAPQTTTTPITPLLVDDLYHRMFSSTTSRPGSLGGGGTLTMIADVSQGAVFHSCAKIMPMRRRKRALPLIFGGLLTILIGNLTCYTFLHPTALTTKYYFFLSTAHSRVKKNAKLLFSCTFSINCYRTNNCW